nr:DNA-3-methyladenine glycosylase [uncultured Carboxylicivirga sp.]
MKLEHSYFRKDVLEVAPDLIGQILVRVFDDGTTEKWQITETEAYRGEEDEACHARKGRTPRTEVMYAEGGVVYVYLIYGMYWLLNVVTGPTDHPQAVLIRGLKNVNGPGRVGKALQLDKTFYGENIITSSRMWIENGSEKLQYATSPRIGIDYAPDEWKLKPWRYTVAD